MKVIRSANKFQLALESERKKGRQIGFVPTMGALHEGHLALVRAAKKKNVIVAVSIFVNPTQFGPTEDFKKYPRVLDQDSQLLKKAGVDYLFYPSVEEIYPKGNFVSIQLDSKAAFMQGLCARFRPGHFEGVATVVAKLFNLTGACRAYFGAKDYQQTVVVKRLVQDFLMPVQIVVCPTIREKDGLAMSSRNRYLTSEERHQALMISQVLLALKRSLEKASVSSMSFDLLKKQAANYLQRGGLKIQYFELVDPVTLSAVSQIQTKMVALVACYCGKTRLIDNVIIRIPQGAVKSVRDRKIAVARRAEQRQRQ